MRLDASYNLCSKLGSKKFFGRNYGNFSFARPFSDLNAFSRGGYFLKSDPSKSMRKRPWWQISAEICQPRFRWFEWCPSSRGRNGVLKILNLNLVSTRVRTDSLIDWRLILEFDWSTPAPYLAGYLYTTGYFKRRVTLRHGVSNIGG